MKLESEVSILIRAPLGVVWDTFTRFHEWPLWSSNFKQVVRQDGGWRFVYRGAQDVDLVFVLKATRLEPQRFIEFATVEGSAHTAEAAGRVEFEETDEGTRVTLEVRAAGDLGSGLAQKLADWWASAFVEPDKNLKLILQDLQTYLEGKTYTEPLQAPPTS